MAVFEECADAIRWSVEVQGIAGEGLEGERLGMRIGMDFGTVELVDGLAGIDVYGLHVNRAARICQACRGGEVLMTRAVWEVGARALGREFGAEPVGLRVFRGLSTPVEVFRLVHPSLATVADVAGDLSGLPGFATPLVGRDELVRYVWGLCTDPDVRVVTLTGPGGIGKTRVAVAVARRAAEAGFESVRYVDVTEALGVSELVPLLLRSHGLPPIAGVDAYQQLAWHLGGRRALLVLDNFEHLLEAAGHVERLVTEVGGLGVLVTSRRRLGILLERTVVVPPLDIPRAGASLEEVREAAAARLFVFVAKAHRPGWEVAPDSVAALVRICRVTGGIPLAVELAAAKVAVFSLNQIAEQVERAPLALSDQLEPRPQRHRSLERVIQWSHGQLSSNGMRAIAQAAVFEGGFKWPAFEAVCECEDNALALRELAGAGLLVVNEKEGNTRYQILEPVRAFVLQQARAEDLAAGRRRHARYFADFVATRAERLHGPCVVEALQELDEERDDLLAAARWALSEEADAETGVGLAIGLSEYLRGSGFWEARLELLKKAEEAVRRCHELGGKWGPQVKYELASVLHDMGGMEQAGEIVKEAAALAAEAGDQATLARAVNLVGLIALDAGRVDEARGRFEEALELWREIGDRSGAGIALNNLGRCELMTGELEAARQRFQAALNEWEAVGDIARQCLALNNLGVVEEEAGRLEEASAYYRQAARVYLRIGDILGLAVAVNNLGEVAHQRGDGEIAVRLIAAACDKLQEIGSPLRAHCQAKLEELLAEVGAEVFEKAASATLDEVIAEAI